MTHKPAPSILRFGALELSTLRMEAGLTVAELARFLGRHECTLARWRSNGIPPWARTLLRLKAGHLDDLGWSGWQIVKGELYAPDLAHGFTQADLYAAHWARRLLRELNVDRLPAKESQR
jgi:transcriptional regulator with XRE-family HTH domain